MSRVREGYYLTRACSLDVNFFFVISKEEIGSEVCKDFLDDVNGLGIDIFICKTVKDTYFSTIKRHLDVLKRVLKQLHEKLLVKQTINFEYFLETMQDVFDNFKRRNDLDRNTKEWIRIFEDCMIRRMRRIDKNKKNCIAEIMCDAYKIIIDFQNKANSTYDFVRTKTIGEMEIIPNEDIIKEAKNVIPDEEDCRHIASSFEYGIKNDRWIFYVSLDEKHIVSKEQRRKIQKKFFIIIPLEPKYGIKDIKKFNSNKPKSPVSTIKSLQYVPDTLRQLNSIVENCWEIKLL